jgi:hypothetical protein
MTACRVTAIHSHVMLRSRQSGMMVSTTAFFLARDQRLICFSRAIAARAVACCSA